MPDIFVFNIYLKTIIIQFQSFYRCCKYNKLQQIHVQTIRLFGVNLFILYFRIIPTAKRKHNETISHSNFHKYDNVPIKWILIHGKHKTRRRDITYVVSVGQIRAFNFPYQFKTGLSEQFAFTHCWWWRGHQRRPSADIPSSHSGQRIDRRVKSCMRPQTHMRNGIENVCYITLTNK